jgi:hypothetical protein
MILLLCFPFLLSFPPQFHRTIYSIYIMYSGHFIQALDLPSNHYQTSPLSPIISCLASQPRLYPICDHAHTQLNIIYIGQSFSISLFMPTSSTLHFYTSATILLGSITAVQRVIQYKLPGNLNHPAPCLPALFITSQRITFQPRVYLSSFLAYSMVLDHTGY